MRKKEVIGAIGEENWDKFSKFIVGQTTARYDDGEIGYYPHDIENFMKKETGKYWFFD